MSSIKKGKWGLKDCGTKRFELTVLGKPQAQQRVRVYVDRKGHAHGVDPKASRENKETIRALASRTMLENHLSIINRSMPVSLCLNIYQPIPKGKPVYWRKAAQAGLIVPCVRGGDIDNILKGVMDALNGVVYEDDCQVYQVNASSYYDETPRIEVSVWGHFQNLGEIKDMVKTIDLDNRTMEMTESLVNKQQLFHKGVEQQ